MDAWQLCHLAPSLVYPMRPDEATGLLVEDVDLGRRRLRFGTRLGGRDFNEGRRVFEVPFPDELVPVLLACIGGRGAGPLLRDRAAFEGRRRSRGVAAAAGDLEGAFEVALAEARGEVQSEQDAESVFGAVLRRAGGASPDGLAREFKALARGAGLGGEVRLYDARAAVTTETNRAGDPELELRYLTGHATSDILNRYVTLDAEGAMAVYFRSIAPLLEAIEARTAIALG